MFAEVIFTDVSGSGVYVQYLTDVASVLIVEEYEKLIQMYALML